MDSNSEADEDIKSEQEQKEPEEDEEDEGKQHFHVLAVDDSLVDRKFLERLLTVSSYQVTCVDSGDKALEYLGLLDIEDNELSITSSSSSSSISSCSSSSSNSSHKEATKVNLIMTDYSMPGITGYDLLKRVKKSSWKDVPVVVMSSENIPSRINMCLEGGAEEFLLKPVKLADLRKLHSHILNTMPQPSNTNMEDSISTEKNSSILDDDDDNNNTDKSKATAPENLLRRPNIAYVLMIISFYLFFLLFYVMGLDVLI